MDRECHWTVWQNSTTHAPRHVVSRKRTRRNGTRVNRPRNILMSSTLDGFCCRAKGFMGGFLGVVDDLGARSGWGCLCWHA